LGISTKFNSFQIEKIKIIITTPKLHHFTASTQGDPERAWLLAKPVDHGNVFINYNLLHIWT